jgi:16S rRNA C967 or C1407 C5-methylase (RsmB/RsmF family)
MAEFSSNISAYLNRLFGEDAAKKFSEFIERESSQYVRVNRIKTTVEELSTVLKEDYDIIYRKSSRY